MIYINLYYKIYEQRRISGDKNNYIDKLTYLSKNTIYDTNSKIIRLKIDDNNNDCILKTDLKDNEWKNTKKIIKEYTKQQIN